MLEKQQFLHFAECEVFGIMGVEKSVGKVGSIVCGNEVTVAVIHPVETQEEIDIAYKGAVIADAYNSEILRNYNIYRSSYDRYGDGSSIHECPLCMGGRVCEVCTLYMKWHIEMPKGPHGRRRRLNSFSNLLLNTLKPPLDYEERERKKENTIINKILDISEKVTSIFKKKSVLKSKYSSVLGTTDEKDKKVVKKKSQEAPKKVKKRNRSKWRWRKKKDEDDESEDEDEDEEEGSEPQESSNSK
jgi:hypothetical protein